MKNTFPLALIFLAVCFLSSCVKDERHCPPLNIKMNESVANYLFNDSSYWVYRNVSTMDIDSQVVFYSDKFTHPTTKPDDGCQVPLGYERYYRIQQHVYGGVDSFTYSAAAPYKMTIYDYVYSYNSPQPSTLVFDLDLPVGQNTDSISFLQQLSSLTIQDSVYYNVSVFHLPMDTQPVPAFPYEMDLYFAPNVGVIRKVEYNTPNGTQTWDLVRYRAIPIED